MPNSEVTSANEIDETKNSFQRILIEDVIRTLDAIKLDKSQSAKRETIRAIFCAIEGSVWVYKEHLRSSAVSISPLTPVQDFALDERIYVVDEKGQIQEQIRFVTIPAMIRLITRIAEQICPEIKIDFGVSGWVNLQQAIKVRNRVTHPKNIPDLTVSEEDVEISISGLFWLLSLIENVLASLTAASSIHLLELRYLAKQLISGNEKALAEYRAALMAQEIE
jgi:hypothetical protein